MDKPKNNNMVPDGDTQATENQATDEQLARHAADLLNYHAQHVTAVTAKRLSVARNLAVNKLTDKQTNVIQSHGNVLHWFGSHVEQYVQQHRAISSALIAAIILAAFFAIQQYGFNQGLENSDAFLLASDLPPEAYADEGFDTWLVSNRD